MLVLTLFLVVSVPLGVRAEEVEALNPAFSECEFELFLPDWYPGRDKIVTGDSFNVPDQMPGVFKKPEIDYYNYNDFKVMNVEVIDSKIYDDATGNYVSCANDAVIDTTYLEDISEWEFISKAVGQAKVKYTVAIIDGLGNFDSDTTYTYEQLYDVKNEVFKVWWEYSGNIDMMIPGSSKRVIPHGEFGYRDEFGDSIWEPIDIDYVEVVNEDELVTATPVDRGDLNPGESPYILVTMNDTGVLDEAQVSVNCTFANGSSETFSFSVYASDYFTQVILDGFDDDAMNIRKGESFTATPRFLEYSLDSRDGKDISDTVRFSFEAENFFVDDDQIDIVTIEPNNDGSYLFTKNLANGGNIRVFAEEYDEKTDEWRSINSMGYYINVDRLNDSMLSAGAWTPDGAFDVRGDSTSGESVLVYDNEYLYASLDVEDMSDYDVEWTFGYWDDGFETILDDKDIDVTSDDKISHSVSKLLDNDIIKDRGAFVIRARVEKDGSLFAENFKACDIRRFGLCDFGVPNSISLLYNQNTCILATVEATAYGPSYDESDNRILVDFLSAEFKGVDVASEKAVNIEYVFDEDEDCYIYRISGNGPSKGVIELKYIELDGSEKILEIPFTCSDKEYNVSMDTNTHTDLFVPGESVILTVYADGSCCFTNEDGNTDYRNLDMSSANISLNVVSEDLKNMVTIKEIAPGVKSDPRVDGGIYKEYKVTINKTADTINEYNDYAQAVLRATVSVKDGAEMKTVAEVDYSIRKSNAVNVLEPIELSTYQLLVGESITVRPVVKRYTLNPSGDLGADCQLLSNIYDDIKYKWEYSTNDFSIIDNGDGSYTLTKLENNWSNVYLDVYANDDYIAGRCWNFECVYPRFDLIDDNDNDFDLRPDGKLTVVAQGDATFDKMSLENGYNYNWDLGVYEDEIFTYHLKNDGDNPQYVISDDGRSVTIDGDAVFKDKNTTKPLYIRFQIKRGDDIVDERIVCINMMNSVYAISGNANGMVGEKTSIDDVTYAVRYIDRYEDQDGELQFTDDDYMEYVKGIRFVNDDKSNAYVASDDGKSITISKSVKVDAGKTVVEKVMVEVELGYGDGDTWFERGYIDVIVKPSDKTDADKPGSGNENTQKPGSGDSTSDQGDGNGSSSSIKKPGTRLTHKKAIYVIKKDGTLTFKKLGNKKLTSAIIPSTVKIDGQNYKVTEIAPNAFSGYTKLKKVTIGKNVKTIGSKAFYNCTSLTKITIPASTKTIGKSAFQKCKKLKTVVIKSKGLTKKSVGKNAFAGISSKAKVKVPKAKLKAYKTLLKSKGVKGKKQKITK